MNVFILEDDLTRMQWFRERLINHTITHAASCTQVERFVGPYDLICLDHDLGGRQMSTRPDSGATFAGSSFTPVCAPFRGPLFLAYLDLVEREKR